MATDESMSYLRERAGDCIRNDEVVQTTAMLEHLEAVEAMHATVDDLATLVRRLVHASRNEKAASGVREKAMDYLQRKGLSGSPLREEQVQQIRTLSPERLGNWQLDLLWGMHKKDGLRPAQVELLFAHIAATSAWPEAAARTPGQGGGDG